MSKLIPIKNISISDYNSSKECRIDFDLANGYESKLIPFINIKEKCGNLILFLCISDEDDNPLIEELVGGPKTIVKLIERAAKEIQ